MESLPNKLLDTPALKKLLEHSRQLHFDRLPGKKFWRRVDPNGRHVVTFAFRHRPNLAMWRGVEHPFDFSHNGGVNVRAIVLTKLKGKRQPQEIVVDFDEKDY